MLDTFNALLRLSVAVAVLVLIPVGCGPSQSDGPGPGGDVGPQGSVGPVGEEEEGIPGSEDITAETVTVGPFDRLVFASEGSVVLTQSETPALRVTADDNLHQYLEAVVADSTLTITTTDGVDIAPSSPIVFEVAASNLSAVELRGVGTVTATEHGFEVSSIVLSGTGDITLEGLNVDEIVVSLLGVGTIRVDGEVDAQEVSVSGMGEYEASELASRIADVEASGTGEVTVWVTGDLTVSVSDSGVVRYYGTPAVDPTVGDSGSVAAMGEK